MSKQECVQDFNVALDKDLDGEVSAEEFANYYANLSAKYSSDDEFVNSLMEAWGLDRDELEQTACLDEGISSFYPPILVFMENPDRNNK